MINNMNVREKIARRNVSLIFMVVGLGLSFGSSILWAKGVWEIGLARYLVQNILSFAFVAMLWFIIPFLAITLYENMK